MCWFDERALNPARKYILKHTTQTVFAKVEVDEVWDVHTLTHSNQQNDLKMNDLGQVNLRLQKPILATTYADNPSTGAFILIDETTYHTVAGGMILAVE
jgi:sulfate adenylyltransferase subunit 1